MLAARPYREGDLAGVEFRVEDEQECLDSTGLPAAECIASAGATPRVTVFDLETGAVAAFYGIEPISGYVWLLATPALTSRRNLKQFLRESRKRLDAAGTELWTAASSKNTEHLRWLSKMGFKAVKAISMGPAQVPFISFVRHPHV